MITWMLVTVLVFNDGEAAAFSGHERYKALAECMRIRDAFSSTQEALLTLRPEVQKMLVQCTPFKEAANP